MASTSAIAEPPSEILQEIQALFSWNPPRLKPASLPPGKKASTGTRPPAFYDKHLPPGMTLQEVIRPSIPHPPTCRKCRYCTSSFLRYAGPSRGFHYSQAAQQDIRNIRPTVRDEKGVASYYDKTAARFCAPLASTLALQVSSSEWLKSSGVDRFSSSLKLRNYEWSAAFRLREWY